MRSLAFVGLLLLHAAAAAQPSVQRSGSGWVIDCRDTERRLCMTLLAGASASVLSGLEALPASLGRITLQAQGLDSATAWRLLLDGAPLGYALACEGRGCRVWLATAAPGRVVAPALLPARQRVESSEGEN